MVSVPVVAKEKVLSKKIKLWRDGLIWNQANLGINWPAKDSNEYWAIIRIWEGLETKIDFLSTRSKETLKINFKIWKRPITSTLTPITFKNPKKNP